MLPRTLANLCSLKVGLDKYTFSIFQTVDLNGKLIGRPTCHKTIIKSCAKLTYSAV